MNKRHQRTLNSIFTQPISGNIKWRDVEALLMNLGATLSERAGSRVAVSLENDKLSTVSRVSTLDIMRAMGR